MSRDITEPSKEYFEHGTQEFLDWQRRGTGWPKEESIEYRESLGKFRAPDFSTTGKMANVSEAFIAILIVALVVGLIFWG